MNTIRKNTVTWDIIGHHSITHYLDASIQENALHHAYLFIGEKHLGKTTLALQFAKRLLDIDIAKSDHPDLIFHQEERKEISVKSIRQILSKCSRKPYSAKYIVTIIEEAQKLNQEASSALLKTLEEPPKHLVVILVAEQKDQLLETIQSRCLQLEFNNVSKEEVQKHETQPPITEHYDGKLGKIFRSDVEEIQKQATAALSYCQNNPFAKSVELAKKIGKDRGLAIQYTEQWLSTLRKEYQTEPSPQNRKNAHECLQTITALKNTNCHVQLAVEQLLLQLS